LHQPVDRRDDRLTGTEPHLGDDGQQHFAERPEVFLGLPDLVHPDAPAGSGHGVLDHALGLATAEGLMDAAVDLVELLEGEIRVM